MSESCASCRFWIGREISPNNLSTIEGFCRRYPPKVSLVRDGDDFDPRTNWPEVGDGDWCGEYSLKRPPKFPAPVYRPERFAPR